MKPVSALDYLNPTDRQLLISVKRRGEAFVDDLATDAGVSHSTVRQRLQAFGADGLIRRRVHVQGAGRPSIAFSLTPRGTEIFPSAAREALVHMLARGCDDASAVVIPKLDVAAAVIRNAAPESPEAAASAAADALEDAGYVAETATLDGTAALLSVVGCPFLVLARHNPALCEAEAERLSAATGCKVRRVAHMLEGSPACDFIISPRESRAEEPRTAFATDGAL